MNSDRQFVTVRLTHDEALVLFDITQRLNEDDCFGELATDQAELVTWWNLTAALEPLIDEAFSPDFDQRLSAAKARLVAE